MWEKSRYTFEHLQIIPVLIVPQFVDFDQVVGNFYNYLPKGRRLRLLFAEKEKTFAQILFRTEKSAIFHRYI